MCPWKRKYFSHCLHASLHHSNVVHTCLSGEHFLTVRAGNAFDSAVFGLSEVNMSDVGAEICFCGEDSDTEMTPLVAGVVSQRGVTHWPWGHAVFLLEIQGGNQNMIKKSQPCVVGVWCSQSKVGNYLGFYTVLF